MKLHTITGLLVLLAGPILAAPVLLVDAVLWIIAIVAVVYLLIRSYRKQAPQDKAIAAEDMVRCAHCGVHLPKGESVEADGQFFCNAEHRDAHRK